MEASSRDPAFRNRNRDGVYRGRSPGVPSCERAGDRSVRPFRWGNPSVAWKPRTRTASSCLPAAGSIGDCYRLEFTTPETTDPSDTCRYLQANDRILIALAERFVHAMSDVALRSISRANVSYGENPTTSGCHESYCCKTDLMNLPQHMIPFLGSRVILTGAGGFNNLVPGIHFTLSPRVAHLERTVSSGSTEDRGIFHTKSEPLTSSGLYRVHILVGESNSSEKSNVLKVGTTALVVAMVDAGLRPGDAIDLCRPLQAMQRFADSVDCRPRARLHNGRRVTALEIQRHYLQFAERTGMRVDAVVGAGHLGPVGRDARSAGNRLGPGTANARLGDQVRPL